MIDHVKLLIVDDRIAIVGGINWGTSSDRNKDFDLEVTGPAVNNLARVFEGDLVICGVNTGVRAAVPDQSVLVMATLPEVKIEPQVLAAIDSAVTSIDLEMYTLTDSAVVHALTRAANRGVSVRILLDSRQKTTNLNAFNQLVASGLSPHWYVGTGLLHAKAVVIDGKLVIVGSANWTASGFGHNHEVDVEVSSLAVASAFEAAINATWRWAS
jgi:phosphatidylserine/phosphatidylglycerophosphate/cardiolipin synthase-like enzyme